MPSYIASVCRAMLAMSYSVDRKIGSAAGDIRTQPLISFVPRVGRTWEMLRRGSVMLNVSVNGTNGGVCVREASFVADLSRVNKLEFKNRARGFQTNPIILVAK